MTYNILILFSKINSPLLFGLELYDSLKRYKECNVYFRYLHFISQDDIESYDAVIPIDVDTQHYYNSLKSSPFLSKYNDTYKNLNDKELCFEIVKKYKQINHIPTLTNKSKMTIKEFITKYPANKYIIKNTKGYASFYQQIISREVLLTKTHVNLSDSILQPKFDNFDLYSLDAICKDGVIINDLFTIIGDTGLKFTDFIFSTVHSEVIDNALLYNPVKSFCDDVVRDTKYSGLIEFEFIITNNQDVYFLEINPRICGHIGQKDTNKNSIYFDKIIIPYLRFFNIPIKNNVITETKYSGTNLYNLLPLIYNLNPLFFIILGTFYIVLLLIFIKKLRHMLN